MYHSIDSFKNSNNTFNIKSINQNKNNEEKKLKEVAEAFESLLVYQMFKSIKKNISSSDFSNKNQAEKIFDDFLTQERSQTVSQNSYLGIAKKIYEQNVRLLNE